jgi:Uma2 family endonuclease
MATTAKLTFEQFQALYGKGDDGDGDYDGYEYWYGEALPRSMPTWVHSLLQQIIGRLLTDAGYIAASELELRIDPDAFPRPDVVATKTKPTGRYPSTGLEVAVEIVSDADDLATAKRKSRKYQEWGFGAIYIVDPSDRSVVEWRDEAATPVTKLASIPVERIWDELNKQYQA